MEPKHIIALEIGSSKIRGAAGTYDPVSDKVTVKAVEEEKLVECVRYGCIQNVAEVTNRVRLIIDRLEARDPQRRVTGVYVGIGGRSVSAVSSTFERRFATETEITRDIISSINSEARATSFNDRDVIDVTPREYRVDGVHVSRPVGTIGRSIQATLNLITAKSQLKRNINSVIRDRLMLKLNGCVVRQLAIANVVLSLEEMRLGCMLVDFGAETTTVSIYRGGTLRYLATLPLGSRNITLDICHLNHLEENAELLKKRNGNAMPTGAANYGNFYDPAGSYSGDIVEMNNYVVARAGEIIENINAQLKYAGLDASKIPSGIIIVGNGAHLKGFNERLEEITGARVRVGNPVNFVVQDPGIRLSDNVDVISILYAAALNGGVDCTEYIPREAPAAAIVEEEVEETVTVSSAAAATAHAGRDNAIDDDPFDDDAHAGKRPERKTFFGNIGQRLREQVLKMMDENDEFESEEN